MYGDLRELNEKFLVPLNIKAKILIYAGYSVSVFFLILSVIFLITAYFIHFKINHFTETLLLVDEKITELNFEITAKIDERLQAERIRDWTQSSIAIEPFIIEILEAMPAMIKIKNISAVLLTDQEKFELVLDIIGKKRESLQFAKVIEEILNKHGCKSAASSTMEVMYGNRIILAAHVL